MPDSIVALIRPSLVLALFFLSPPATRGELLYFRAGGQVQAPATVEGGKVVIHTPGGDYWFLKEDFRKIVPGHCPEREWPEKRDAALRAGVRERTAAAWWALENGLTPEAVAMLRSARQADPSSQPAARMNAMLDRLERPVDDPPTDQLRRSLMVPTESERGTHVLLLHQHAPAVARSRVDLIERVITTYYLTFSAYGIELNVPRRRLVSVHLRERDDYQAFLRSQQAGAFFSTLGYYHPTHRAVITYDERTTGKFKAASGAADPSPALMPANVCENQEPGDPDARDQRRRRMLDDLNLTARSLGTAAHETVHFLVQESGLAPCPERFPLWLHEGLATQFEVVRGGRWSGTGRAHDLRLPDWRSQPSPDLPLLLADFGFGRGYRRDPYANSWSLVYFLRKTRPDQFCQWLDLLRLPENLNATTPLDDARSKFQEIFGSDLPGLGSEWIRYMRDVSTPLEENSELLHD